MTSGITLQMRALQAGNGYEAALYTPSDFIVRLNRFFSAIRFMHDDNFADFVSPQRDEQVDYTYGVMFFSTMLAVIVFCWALILIMLKCRGDGGCASGKAFQTESDAAREEGWIENGHTTSREFDSSIASDSQGRQSGASSTISYPSLPTDLTASSKKNKGRATRTRIVFLIFGMGVIASIVLFLVFSFSSIKENLDTTGKTMRSAQEIIDQLTSAVRTIEAAGAHASEVIAKTDLNFRSICPNATLGKGVLGIDLESFAETATDEFGNLKKLLREHLEPIDRTLNKIQQIKDDVEIGLEETQTYSWAFPIFLLCVAVVTTIAMLGVILALRRRSGRTFQNCMTYGTLPLLMAFCFICWLGTISAGIGAMSTGDACVAQGDAYGPDSTIAEILDRHNLDHNSTTYKMVYSYTNACRISNPTQELVDIEEALQVSVNSIWLQISEIDGVGRTNVSIACGSDELNHFLDGTRQLAKSLSTIRKAVDSTIGTLHCKNINPIYVEAIHEGICGDIANGLGIAFVLLLSLSICLMVLITLRASWLDQRIADFDDKMYAENDAADNMIVNEHEEYLSYISRYKHEWEDYEGINPGNVDAEEREEEVVIGGASASEDLSYSESYFLDEESAYESSLAQSSLPDDISFPSLQVTPSNVAAAAAAPILMIPGLLPRSSFDDEEEQEIQVMQVMASDRPRNHQEMQSNMPIPMSILASNLVEGDIDVDVDTNPYQSNKSEDIEISLFTSQPTSNEGPRPPSGRHQAKSEEESDDQLFRTKCRSKDQVASSSDDDSLKDFTASSDKYVQDDEIAMRYYGAKLRTKESIEAGLALHYASSSDHHEFRDDDDESRDSPPPPTAPVENLFARQYVDHAAASQEAESAQTSTFSNTQAPKVSDMIERFNQLYHL